jgi:hypothetical protein
MVEKSFDGDTKKLFMYRAGIRIGYEEYQAEKLADEDRISIKTYTAYSHAGNDVKQNVQLLLDNDYNTLKMEVALESKSVYERYTFTYKNSEAHIWVDQESRIPNWEGKKLDKTIVWDNKCLVIPSTNSFFSLMQTEKKYSYDSKGKQNVACGIVPKVIFTLDYLGEDMLEVGDKSFSCKRFQIVSSREGTMANAWIDNNHGVFKFVLSKEMISLQSFEMK